jgi:beta-N-acetylhexosaminidase
MIKKRKAFIVGIRGTILTKKEKNFLTQYKPWGIILFSRNIKNLNQIKKLTRDIRIQFNDYKYPIMIDQEGGRINRLKTFIDTNSLTGEYFGHLFKHDKKKFVINYNIFIKKISNILNEIGININTVPVLDLQKKGSSSIIGDRAFSSNSKIVSKVGDFCIKVFSQQKIATVIKHIPGHGLAKVDSHKSTPTVYAKSKFLIENDFSCFKKKDSLFSMTAHIIYKNIDPLNTATHSNKIIKLIRNQLEFNNIIISDDISMKALKFSVKINTQKAFTAGCNLVLHCNANYKEMKIVADNSPLVDNFIIKKTSQFYKLIS